MNKISLEHVDKVYDKGVQVIEDLNLDIREGSFTILLGLWKIHDPADDSRAGGCERRKAFH